MVMRAKPKRMYRTMQGRMVDIEKLRAANESTQAVGNMNVNARGDVLGAGGQVVTPKAKVMQKYYEQPKGVADDTPTRNKPAPAPQTKAVETKIVEPKKAATPKVATPKAAPKKTVAPKKGIDAALDGLE
jgi:outer membrane biosynthesis protein TonB|tara:strand:- start:111 stop:500 length:390 start_codon:yes stop_codon:yes gene_type:complete